MRPVTSAQYGGPVVGCHLVDRRAVTVPLPEAVMRGDLELHDAVVAVGNPELRERATADIEIERVLAVHPVDENREGTGLVGVIQHAHIGANSAAVADAVCRQRRHAITLIETRRRKRLRPSTGADGPGSPYPRADVDSAARI